MITSKHDRRASSPKNASRKTTILRKYARMTEREAHSVGRLGKADVHMHSTYSDGIGTIEQILEHVQHQTDLDVIALTDHDGIEGALRARDLWARGWYRFDFIVGEEVSTKEGHLLGLFIEKPILSGLSMERSIDLIHEQGGLAVVAHPLHKFFKQSCQRNVMDRISAAKDVRFDGVETWNASFCGMYTNSRSMKANRTIYGLPELGNSDAHTLNAVGCGFTWFEGKSAQDLRASIEQGVTAPGGKMWEIQAYYDLLRYRISQKGRQTRQADKAVA